MINQAKTELIKKGKGDNIIIQMINNAHIENELNSNITIDDIMHKYEYLHPDKDTLWISLIAIAQSDYDIKNIPSKFKIITP